MIYKVSYVVVGGEDPGAIANVDKPPQVGDRVTLGSHEFEIVEILELMPPRGEFSFLHATCKMVTRGVE
ncbi:MAG: hypothetical protein JXB30_09130 [Anaerolineae bacterium]|nr:hypothetical protein [Anaerolineae bacterium]